MPVRLSAAITLAAFLCTAQAAAVSQPSASGLQRVDSSKVNYARVLPGVAWSRYRTVEIRQLVIPDEVRDTAPRGTKPGFGESYILGDKEVEMLQKAYAEAMRNALEKDSGFRIVAAPEAGTLVLAAKLIDIRLNAPVKRRNEGRSRIYTQTSGSMTIAAVLADGDTGQVLVEVADRRYPANDMWRINNRVTNLADARQIFGRWGRVLRDWLDEKHAAAEKRAAR